MKNKHSSDTLDKRTKNLVGQRFGRLVVTSYYGHKNGRVAWNCLCDCGKTTVVLSGGLCSGKTKSCGCYHSDISRKQVIERFTKHGGANTAIYSRWCSMKDRCCNPNNPSYHNYGGRGITICDEWVKDFEAFRTWAYENGYRPNLTLERIDNNKGYSPDNCRFISNARQQRNRRKTVMLTYNGETKPLATWCDIYGLNLKTCYNRLHNYKWDNPHEILFGKGAKYAK